MFPFIDTSTAVLPNGALCCCGYKMEKGKRRSPGLRETP